MWTTDTKNTRYILCNLKNELLYVIKLFSGYQGSERGEWISGERGDWTTDTLQCEPPILKTRDIYFAISKMNYCTSLNCSVDIRGAGRLNHRYFAMWTTDTKNTRYILCNLKNELLYVIKLFSGYQGSERGEWTTKWITASLNCSVDIRGAGRLNHRYFAMWTTDTKNTRYILCNLKNELLYVIKLFSGYQGSGRLNHRYFAMWTTDTKNTRYILCNLKNELLYVIKLFSGYQGSERGEWTTKWITASLNCSVDIRGAGRLNHRYFAMWTTDTKNTRYILCNLKNELLYVIKLFSGYQGSGTIEPPILCNVNHRY